MSTRGLRDDLFKAIFIGAAAAGAYLLASRIHRESAEDEVQRWLSTSETEFVPPPNGKRDLRPESGR